MATEYSGNMAMPMGQRKNISSDLTPQDILDRLATHDMMDEIEVSNKYLDYAEALNDAGKNELAMQVYEMAYEEFTHARFQKHILAEMDRDVPDELMLHYHRLKDRFRQLFRV